MVLCDPSATSRMPISSTCISRSAESSYRRILRRPVVVGPGEQAFGYSVELTPILWAFIVVNAIEIPALHLLLPWQTARRIIDVLGIVSIRTRPRALTKSRNPD
jgi:hypothetical protein